MLPGESSHATEIHSRLDILTPLPPPVVLAERAQEDGNTGGAWTVHGYKVRSFCPWSCQDVSYLTSALLLKMTRLFLLVATLSALAQALSSSSCPNVPTSTWTSVIYSTSFVYTKSKLESDPSPMESAGAKLFKLQPLRRPSLHLWSLPVPRSLCPRPTLEELQSPLQQLSQRHT